MVKEEKVKLDAREMKMLQALSWLESLNNNNPLGTSDQTYFIEIMGRLKDIHASYESKIKKQEKVIDFILTGTKISGKDKGELIKILLE